MAAERVDALYDDWNERGIARGRELAEEMFRRIDAGEGYRTVQADMMQSLLSEPASSRQAFKNAHNQLLRQHLKSYIVTGLRNFFRRRPRTA